MSEGLGVGELPGFGLCLDNYSSESCSALPFRHMLSNSKFISSGTQVGTKGGGVGGGGKSRGGENMITWFWLMFR